jgi:RNA polymerase sigma-70 factor, ECF subfamily
MAPDTYTLWMQTSAMPLAGSAEAEAQWLARGLRSQDRTVINELIEWYQFRLARYLLYITGRRENVEDLAQETWLRVFERGIQFDGRSRFEPWLFSIARNLAIDQFRKSRATSLDSCDTVKSGNGAASEGVHSSHPSPFLAAARNEDAARLATAMDLLEPIYREVLLLRFHEELSLQEIADVTGAAVTTVSSRIYRGLAALRSKWEGGTNAL